MCSLSDAMVLGGEIFSGDKRYLMSRRSPFLALSQTLHEFEEVGIPNSMQGLQYFGHWLGDDCPAYEVLARSSHPQISSMRRPDWADAATYEAAFEQDWTGLDAFFATSMTLVRELGFNLDKRARIETLRRRLRNKYEPNRGVVFVARGASGNHRSPSNQDELIHFLAAEGVRIVFPEVDVQDVIAKCLDADVVITVEGSQARHAKYGLRHGGALLVLQPPDRFYNPHIEWTRLLGMRYGIVIGLPHGEGFRIEPEEVMQMLATLSAH
jgi:hypothetical protein